jgi:hypothetical protein
MAEFSSKEASGAVILLIYMSAKLHRLRDNEIFYRSSARCPGLAALSSPEIVDSLTKQISLKSNHRWDVFGVPSF